MITGILTHFVIAEMSGKKGRSGRRKNLGTQIDDAMELLSQNLPELISKLMDKARNGDKDALIYLIDRRMGRPHQSIDQRIKGFVLFTADDYKLAIDVAEEEDRLLKEGTDAVEQG